MNLEQWKEVDKLLQSVLELPREQREAFLRRACAGNDSLETNVRSLLALESAAGDFLESPAIEVEAIAVARSTAAQSGDLTQESSLLAIGEAVSHYRIVGYLGRGGMGVVYKAEDQRLRRSVALKFLSEQYARDPEHRSRLHREARAASSLNHPNICTIFDIDEHNGHTFLVMECLHGKTLKHYIVGRRLNIDTLSALAVEIAAGLDAAHNVGIVHRDIKPANIFITEIGRAHV